MLRAVAAAVARSANRASGSGRVRDVVLDQQHASKVFGAANLASNPSPLPFQLRSVACAATSTTAAAAATKTAGDVATEATTPETATASTTTPAPSFRAAIDFRALKASLPAAVANAKDRRAVGADPELVARLYDEWRALQDELERARAERNENAKAMKVRWFGLVLFFLCYSSLFFFLCCVRAFLGGWGG